MIKTTTIIINNNMLALFIFVVFIVIVVLLIYFTFKKYFDLINTIEEDIRNDTKAFLAKYVGKINKTKQKDKKK